MPTRVHRGHVPPTTLDRLLAHPWAVSLAIFWAVVGAQVATAALTGRHVLTEVTAPVAAWLGIQLAAGALAVLTGIFWRGTDSTAWTVRVIGVIGVGSCWSAWALVEDDPYFLGLALAMVAGCSAEVAASYASRETWHRLAAQSRRAQMQRRLRG